MNKKQLLELVADDTGMSKADAGRAVDAVFNRIGNALAAGNEATFVGFGTFKVVDVAERTGRNPQTGEVIVTPAKKKPKFVAGTALKEAVNRQS